MASTYDDRTEVLDDTHERRPAAPQRRRAGDRDVTDWARGLPAERPPRGFLDRRRFVETKWSFKTTELLVLIIAAAGLLITALTNDGFDAYGAWKWGTVLAVGYMISRGLAKLGKGTYDDD
jgi:hypothetical protein